MFEVSWGELIFLTGAGLALIGRNDLPRASYFVGRQMGRVVGMLQGARSRADQFAKPHEDLRQLHNELRFGLREFDSIRSEMMTSMTVGRHLTSTATTTGSSGSSVGGGAYHGGGGSGGSSRNSNSHVGAKTTSHNNDSLVDINRNGNNPTEQMITATMDSHGGTFPNTTTPTPTKTTRELAPRYQSVAAVAEEEWIKRGIGFQSKAERGASMPFVDVGASGSALLANLIQQSLIHDQHDRAVREREEALRNRMVSPPPPAVAAGAARREEKGRRETIATVSSPKK